MTKKHFHLAPLSAAVLSFITPELAFAEPNHNLSNDTSLSIMIDEFGRPSVNKIPLSKIIKDNEKLHHKFAQTNVICKVTNNCKASVIYNPEDRV